MRARPGKPSSAHRRGTLRSVAELERAINQWLANWNAEPRPFVGKPRVILDKVRLVKSYYNCSVI